MRALLVSMLMLTSLAPARAAEAPRLAVFDFEMIDGDLGESGNFRILDIG